MQLRFLGAILRRREAPAWTSTPRRWRLGALLPSLLGRHPPTLLYKLLLLFPLKNTDCGNLQTSWGCQPKWPVVSALLKHCLVGMVCPNPTNPIFLSCAFCKVQGFSGTSSLCFSRGTGSHHLLLFIS